MKLFLLKNLGIFLFLFSVIITANGQTFSSQVNLDNIDTYPEAMQTSTVDFREETIYFLMTARFYDGDPDNSAPNEWCSYNPDNPEMNIDDPNDVTWRGDFKGLIQKLDYIKDLGFTAIWVTPIVQNAGPLDYHGYHAWDFNQVDKRLESPGATFQDLVNAVHAKDMKIVLDVVTNHSGRYGIKGHSELKYNTDPTQPWGQDSDGNILQPNPNWAFDGLTPNPDDGKIWSRANIPPMPAPYNDDLSQFNWPCTEAFVNTSDPVWYHHSGNGFVQGWDDTENSYNRALAGDTPDLNTGSLAVQDYMFNAYKRYIDMGVDAFRWDTFKHMSKEDILALLDRFKAYKPDLFIFGEVAQKRHELHPVEELNPHWYTWRGAVNASEPSGASVIDFYGEATFHNVFEDGGGFSGVQDCARYDHLYADPSELVTWLDNHDFGPNNDWNRRYGGSDENLAACMNFMFTWRGIPCVYYGTEKRFKAGAYADIHNAAAINESLDNTGRAYYGNEFDTAPDHVIYQHIKKINAIRKAVPALQKGAWQWAGNAPGNGVGYTRQFEGSEVAVGLAKDGSASFDFSGLTNGMYRDAVTGAAINVTNGNLSFTVGSGSAGIYVLNGPGMIGESGAGFFEPCVQGCAPPVVVQISPTSNNYSDPVTVNISAEGGSGGHTIHYTLDGSEPTTGSPIYSGSFAVSSATTVRAIAVDSNGKISDLNGQVYTFEVAGPRALISPFSGNYYDPIEVSITGSEGTPPYTIFYTTNGSEPTTSSSVYSAPFTISNATTVKAIVRDANNILSSVVTRDYTFIIPPPTVEASPDGGNFQNPPVSVTLTASSPRPPVTIYYTTDGSTPTASSSVYSSPISVNGTEGQTYVLQFFGRDAEGRDSDVYTENYTFNPIPDLTVYFKRPASFGNTVPNIYHWAAEPMGSLVDAEWPGVPMDPDCEDWFKFTFPNGVTSSNVIFNNGNSGVGTNQTPDLTATEVSYYDGSASMNGTSLTPGESDCSGGGGTLTASFTATPLSGDAPLLVSVDASGSSTPNGTTITDYSWNFGNGTTGSGVTTSYTYTTPGTYFITLAITNSDGQNATSNLSVTVNPESCSAPAAPSLSASSNNINSGQTATLTASGCSGTVNWYASPSGGSPLATGSSYTTPSLSSTTTYYADCTFNNCTSSRTTITVSVTTPPSGIKVYFQKPDEWGANINIYYWNPSVVGGGSPPPLPDWPGETMTNENDGWYSFTFPQSFSSTNIIFNDGGSQTVDLFTDQTAWYTLCNTWVYSDARTATPQSFDVLFENTAGWSQPMIHYWNAEGMSPSETDWPGENMTLVSGNTWKFSFTNTALACLLFHDGNGTQTEDLGISSFGGTYNYSSGEWSLPALPMEFTAFDIQTEDCYVTLNWEVAAEQNLEYYLVETSKNGEDFFVIQKIEVTEPNVLASNKYAYQSENSATNYYRIAAVEKDGSITYTQILFADNPCEQSEIHIFPNPFGDFVTIRIDLVQSAKVRVEVVNVAGQLVQALGEQNLEAGKHQATLEMSHLPKGVYFCRFWEDDRVVVKRLVSVAHP